MKLCGASMTKNSWINLMRGRVPLPLIFVSSDCTILESWIHSPFHHRTAWSYHDSIPPSSPCRNHQISIVSSNIMTIYLGVVKTCIHHTGDQKHALISYTSIVNFMIRMILTLMVGSYAGVAISVMSFSAFLAWWCRLVRVGLANAI